MEKGRTGEAYNIGTGVSTDFNTIYEIIKEEMIGFKAKISLDEGIDKLIKYYNY